VPHVLLAGSIPAIDTAGEGFAMLVENGQTGWAEAASALDVPVAVRTVEPGDVPAGGVLIRPDGVIAWRPDGAGADHLPAVVSRLVSRS
jgi:hypothetical protein